MILYTRTLFSDIQVEFASAFVCDLRAVVEAGLAEGAVSSMGDDNNKAGAVETDFSRRAMAC